MTEFIGGGATHFERPARPGFRELTVDGVTYRLRVITLEAFANGGGDCRQLHSKQAEDGQRHGALDVLCVTCGVIAEVTHGI
jgi:hypothetical protein